MTTFYLVRHGQRARTSGDPPLSRRGITQARATAERLWDRPLAAVYSSPLRRARETADWLARPHALHVVRDPRLRERINWGDLPGQSFDEFIALWERCTREREYVPPVGDSAQAAGQRVESFVRERAERHPGGEIAAVLHGGVLTDFLLNVCDGAELNRLHADFVEQQSLLVPECSITVVHCDGAAYHVECFAATQHLTGLVYE